MQIKDELLSAHEASPFLEDYELKVMSTFKASESWSFKMAKLWDWKFKRHGKAGGLDKDLGMEEINESIFP